MGRDLCLREDRLRDVRSLRKSLSHHLQHGVFVVNIEYLEDLALRHGVLWEAGALTDGTFFFSFTAADEMTSVYAEGATIIEAIDDGLAHLHDVEVYKESASASETSE